jgi:hypothetical protein
MTKELPAWDVFVVSMVACSPGYAALVQATGKLCLPVRCLGMMESPYIDLHTSWEELIAAPYFQAAANRSCTSLCT